MKVFLITHTDVDGVTPVILTKYVFQELNYLLLQASEINKTLMKLIEDDYFNDYDIVFITDLSLNEELCKIIDNDKSLRKKIKVFDHHSGNIFVNDYSFAKVIDIDEFGNKQSGTSLYYQYLLENYPSNILSSNSIKTFVELVRQLDTWEWFNKYSNYDAKKLGDLFSIYGKTYFINYYLKYLKENKEFSFSDKELYLLEIEQQRIDNYIEEKSRNIIPVHLLGYKVGLVFAEKYKSEMGNILATKYQNIYDFIVMINIATGISYRGIKDIHLGEVVKVFGGGGHKESAGSSISDEIRYQLIKMIFGDNIIIDDVVNTGTIYDRVEKI